MSFILRVNAPSKPAFLMGTDGQGTNCQQYFPVPVTLKNGLNTFPNISRGDGRIMKKVLSSMPRVTAGKMYTSIELMILF